MAKKARPYQIEAFNAVIDYIKNNIKNKQQSRGIVDAGPGAGKTFMISDIAANTYRKGGRVVILAHQPVLAGQTYDELYEHDVPAAMFSAKFGKKQVGKVTVGSVGTVANALNSHFMQPVDLLLIDEGHQVPVEEERSQYMKIINHFTCVAQQAGRICHIITYTGSPFRFCTRLDNLYIGPRKLFWEDIIYDISSTKLTEMGFLSPPVFGFPDKDDAAYDFSAIKERSGTWEYSEEELNAIVNSEDGKLKLHKILAEVIDKTKDRNMRIIFASTKAHAREVKRALIAMGVEENQIGLVTDDSSEQEKDFAMDGAKKGTISWLINVSCLTTGFDAPLIDCVIFLRPVGSLTLLIQCMGRGARLLHPWMKEAGYIKDNYLVLDFAGVFDRLGHMFDDPLLGQADLTKSEKKGELQQCPRCATWNGENARRCRGLIKHIREDNPAALEAIEDIDGRCDFFFIQGTICPECGTENDKTTKNCRKCKHELIDPNQALLHKAYSDDEMREVVGMTMGIAANGGLRVEFQMKEPNKQHGNPNIFFPPIKGDVQKRIWNNTFVDIYVKPEFKHYFYNCKNYETVIKLQRAVRCPIEIAYRINEKGKFVIGRRRF